MSNVAQPVWKSHRRNIASVTKIQQACSVQSLAYSFSFNSLCFMLIRCSDHDDFTQFNNINNSIIMRFVTFVRWRRIYSCCLLTLSHSISCGKWKKVSSCSYINLTIRTWSESKAGGRPNQHHARQASCCRKSARSDVVLVAFPGLHGVRWRQSVEVRVPRLHSSDETLFSRTHIFLLVVVAWSELIVEA